MPPPETFDQAVADHDRRLAELGLDIWVGAEPTFTDRVSEQPEWLHQALGGDKARRAQSLLAGLCRRFPGGVLLRTLGRQYPGEALPRWSLGLYRRRDGGGVWDGPDDPLLDALSGTPPALSMLAEVLASRFRDQGWPTTLLPAAPPAVERRLMMRLDPDAAEPAADDPRLMRPSIHGQSIPEGGLDDDLARIGVHLFLLTLQTAAGGADEADGTVRLELPAFASVDSFLGVLRSVAQWAAACGLPALILAGFPPPVDATVEWTTVTPDPAVIEINSAPDATARAFLQRARATYEAASQRGLSPCRLYYNGTVADSGGGGQITLGGPSPQASPFLLHPHLLPRLVRYLNRHPALSYLFSHDYAGSSGQSVRADERGLEALDELALTLSLLERQTHPQPELIWRGLAPFLCDASGNSHRAEINIEKLHNPYLPGRGQLGLVEFRALRMQHTPERVTALVCLLRALVAMLARNTTPLPLMDWGRELHQHFALPYYLEQDLGQVLSDLEMAGVGLAVALRKVLLADEFRDWGRLELPGCELRVRRAVEFWPLLGDTGSQERGTSRLVDASTSRVELMLRAAPGQEQDLAAWRLAVRGIPLPMREEHDGLGPLRVFGLRYRSFTPMLGVHPTLGAQSPVRVELRHPTRHAAVVLTLHEWRPDSGGYPGLPRDAAEAAERRQARLTLEGLPPGEEAAPRLPPQGSLSPWFLDLRYLDG